MQLIRHPFNETHATYTYISCERRSVSNKGVIEAEFSVEFSCIDDNEQN